MSFRFFHPYNFGVKQMKNTLYLIVASVLILIFTGLFINVQNISPAPHLDDLDSGTLLDSLYALLLAGLVLFLAAGLGTLLLKPFKFKNWSFTMRAVLSLPLGLAAIAYGEFLLGLVGWLKPVHQLLFLLIVAGVGFREGVRFLSEGWAAVRGFRSIWVNFSRIRKFFFIVGVAALLLALMVTFTPPFDYDGLMYHLQGPRLFLEAGRIIPIPENWFTYYPATWEMLFMLGMGLGSDIFARLISFSTLLIFLLTTFAFGKRYLPAPGGWLSAAMVISVPMMLAWGGFAYVDLPWSLFQFLAIGLLLMWIENREDKLLILSGIMQGLALGSKYTALSGVGIIGLVIFWFSVNKKYSGCGSIKSFVSSILKFAIPTVLIASPWYLKNLIWTGNPTFPFFLPQSIIDTAELDICLDYLSSFGTGRSIIDYLLIPVTVFIDNNKFSTFTVLGDFPNPVMLLSIVYPFIRKKFVGKGEILDVLIVITFIQYIVWMASSLQSRFLMPLFPGVSIIASAVIISFSHLGTKTNWAKILSIGAVGGMLVSTLLLVGNLYIRIKPHEVIIGTQSKREFLSAYVFDFKAIDYINSSLPDDVMVFLLWDGRGYYCYDKCLPDIGQSRWTAATAEIHTIEDISIWLETKGITHILLSRNDVRFFIYDHDQDGLHEQALTFLIEDFAPKCAEVVYEDEWSLLYELHLDDNACQ
jgi:hypothetical protein